jgi:hypothetical protein
MGAGVGVGGTGVAVAGMGVDGDPQAERMKERKRMRLRKRRSVDKISILYKIFRHCEGDSPKQSPLLSGIASLQRTLLAMTDRL